MCVPAHGTCTFLTGCCVCSSLLEQDFACPLNFDSAANTSPSFSMHSHL